MAGNAASSGSDTSSSSSSSSSSGATGGTSAAQKKPDSYAANSTSSSHTSEANPVHIHTRKRKLADVTAAAAGGGGGGGGNASSSAGAGGGGGGGGGGNASFSAGGSRRDDNCNEDSITLLRAAIQLRDRTGAVPNLHLCPEIYKCAMAHLRQELSEKDVFNRLNSLYRCFKSGNACGNHIMQQLSAQLWSNEADQKAKADNKKAEKDQGAGCHEEEEEEEEEGNEEDVLEQQQQELFPNMATAVIQCCKDELEYPPALLDATLKRVNLADAKALEGKWTNFYAKKMELQVEGLMLKMETLRLLLQNQ